MKPSTVAKRESISGLCSHKQTKMLQRATQLGSKALTRRERREIKSHAEAAQYDREKEHATKAHLIREK